MRILAAMDVDHKIKSVSEFLEFVDRGEFQSETGYSGQLVQRAKTTGVFPAHWFWTVRDFCDARKMKVPEYLFRGHPQSASVDGGAA